ncbi:MAG: tRNA pseudouridine(55) synthase TruB [Bifidobacteriaceae bacterium]|nr:tRNA pseudouridine(55) synthase TruB [Bifidobacteriaceae bacterium]MCI1978885.1 tRNA pseudouridine(55) synthase TruB [Bifidobacteriaceae bacterium]
MTDNSQSRLPAAGFLLVDKPCGVTSHDVVAACRGALHTRRVGHAGTLDPMASGLLVIGFGYATRLLKYVVGTEKTYEAVIRLGASTTTDDVEGEMTPPVQPESVRERLKGLKDHPELVQDAISRHFTGTVSQVPSTFSAIKVDGERAYNLAREGQTVELAARDITISDFSVLGSAFVKTAEQEEPATDIAAEYLDLTVSITCSAGTYIRAIARDMGAFLGVGGYLTFLRRTRIGDFSVTHAVGATTRERTFTDKQGTVQTRTKVQISPDEVLPAVIDVVDGVRGVVPLVEVTDEQARDLRFGRRIAVSVSQPTAALHVDADGGRELCAMVEPCEYEEAEESAKTLGDSGFPMAQPTAVFHTESRPRRPGATTATNSASPVTNSAITAVNGETESRRVRE